METYTIHASINCVGEATIKACSWEEAVEKAKRLGTPDFISPKEGDVFVDFEPPVLNDIMKEG